MKGSIMRKRDFWTLATTLTVLSAYLVTGATPRASAQEPKKDPEAKAPDTKAPEEKPKEDAPKEAVPLAAPDADGFINLFNGKDLTWWEGVTQYWSVKDDAITGSEVRTNSLHTFLVLSDSK